MPGTPKSVDAYLAPLDPAKRAALAKLRKDILAAAPGAEECISYGIPAVRLDGRMLAAYGAAAEHCAFYPGPSPIAACAEALARYSTSKGTIRFDPAKPLPAALVRRIVKLRIAEQRS